MKAMNIIELDYIDLSDLMHTVAELGFIICCTLSDADAFELMKELSVYSDIQFGNINLMNKEFYEYDREYYVTLDPNMVLDVEPAWDEHYGRYLYNDAEVYLFEGSSNAAIMDGYQDRNCFELCILK